MELLILIIILAICVGSITDIIKSIKSWNDFVGLVIVVGFISVWIALMTR